MVYVVENDDIADCWEDLVKLIYSKGHFVNDERGSLTKELLNVVTRIKTPLGKQSNGFFGLGKEYVNIENIKIPEGYFWAGDRVKTYAEQFLSRDNPGFVYTYGSRLRNYEVYPPNEKDEEGYTGIDQIKVAIDRLKNCKESRRAISVTWDPHLDTVNDEVPCLILVDFKIRHNKLYTTGLWRSHDIYGAWFANAVGLTYLAQHVADEVGVEIAPITIHSISAHIYENNFGDAQKRCEKSDD
ncbi:thymidylate synthase [Methanobrevibacter sp. 87.7]|uniref:thymidylate synthase n=1 Tax=Methanobrevibacter sp. 87.7 TaxID=387957 RepID=UPI000B511402|nr:thymidylate synthase [Methanobrevibacter sp. 87.7]OWT32358.1 thymidylate synthase [Methanobrevibacter sp. 87.7]